MTNLAKSLRTLYQRVSNLSGEDMQMLEEAAKVVPAKAETIRPMAPIVYWVETTKSPASKSSYERRLTTESKSHALFYYLHINIGRGYKKRLRAHSPDLQITRTLERQGS